VTEASIASGQWAWDGVRKAVDMPGRVWESTIAESV
jgi:hypothetical protein